MTVRAASLASALVFTLALSACGEEAPPSGATTGAVTTGGAGSAAERWYEPVRVERGASIHVANCAACHGDGGQGSFTWRKRDAAGKMPPPPLNGTGHTWHHPFRVLGSQIKFGAPGGQGTMPGFAEILSDEDLLDVIAWFQSKWTDEIYTAWFDIETRSRNSSK